ncbi:MAG TPA: DUF983 domain-containing protein [Stellaceae bacterium]|nr:DUF983 domain-containing protein [Stellaceae bacterium]
MIAPGTGERPDRWTAVMRGFRERCPRCGEGRLYRSYLKLSQVCVHCGEVLGDIRADDGPAWLTILVVGHLTVPFFLIAVRFDAPSWVIFGVLVPATVALTAILLPRLKGVFASLLWSLDMRSGSPG